MEFIICVSYVDADVGVSARESQSMGSHFEMKIHHILILIHPVLLPLHDCYTNRREKRESRNKKYSSKFNLAVQCQREFYILSLQGHKTNPYYIHNTD